MGSVWVLSHTIFQEHDLNFVALALGICGLGSLTAIAVAQHALKPEVRTSQRRWLLLAGFVTGLTVWTTHFTAMLGYRSDLDIRYDLISAFFAFLLSIALSGAAWVGCFGRHRHGLLGGALIGVGIAIAHFIDMHSIQVAGTIQHNHLISLVAIGLGISLAAISGLLFVRSKPELIAWPAALVLCAAIITLHFVAMSGVSIASDATPLQASSWSANTKDLTALVVGAFLFLLSAAGVTTLQSASLVRTKMREQGQLIEALNTLRETQNHHHAYLELSRQIGWAADPEGRITELAPLWEELVGLPNEQAHGWGWGQVVHPDDLPEVLDVWQRAVASGDGDIADVRYRMLLKDGSYRWFRARAQPRLDESGAVMAWYGSLEDIEDQVNAETALRESEERYRFVSHAANDVIWDWSVETKRATWTGAHEKILGYTELAAGTDGKWWAERVHPEDLPRVLASQQTALDAHEESWTVEYRFRVASGDWIDVRTCSLLVRNVQGDVVRVVGSMLDITEQKLAQKELSWAAFHDSLTGLPNRARYLAKIVSAIDAAKRTDRYVALVLLDLNRFKDLNDSLGHAAGDTVLETIANRLSAGASEDATIARLGGDEFAIILPDLERCEAYRPEVERLVKNLADPVVFEDMRIPISLCAGVSIFPRDGSNPGELLIAADLALYAAKGDAPGAVREFSPSLKAVAELRTKMLETAGRALDEDKVFPFYQPKVDLQTGEIDGWEALLRIRVDGVATLLPAAIEAAFADVDLSVAITDRMFARVFADLAHWQSLGCEPGRIAINVSAADFRQGHLSERLQFHADMHGQSVAQIDIEVTENVLIGRLGAEVLTMLEELQALGVRIVLDDFGTGYASLTHLQQFPVDVIKLDRSFIERIDEGNPKATAVIDAVLQMARLLDIRTVAEGIETCEQARYLRARACTSGQGYLFSHPVASAEVEQLLSNRSPADWQSISPFAPIADRHSASERGKGPKAEAAK